MFLPLPSSDNSGEAEQEIAEDDLGVSYYKDDAIDLGEVMREQFYLALPMKPLCRETARGLCPVCGINRNRETCACQAEWVDPRLEALKKFRRRTRIRDDAESETTPFEDAHGQAPHARRAQAHGDGRVPAVPRAEAAAHRVPELRVLPRPPGPAVDEE